MIYKCYLGGLALLALGFGLGHLHSSNNYLKGRLSGCTDIVAMLPGGATCQIVDNEVYISLSFADGQQLFDLHGRPKK